MDYRVEGAVADFGTARFTKALMALLEEIRRKIDANEFEFPRHAVDQTIIRESASGRYGKSSLTVR